jgi:hypothetical protein
VEAAAEEAVSVSVSVVSGAASALSALCSPVGPSKMSLWAESWGASSKRSVVRVVGVRGLGAGTTASVNALSGRLAMACRCCTACGLGGGVLWVLLEVGHESRKASDAVCVAVDTVSVPAETEAKNRMWCARNAQTGRHAMVLECI